MWEVIIQQQEVGKTVEMPDWPKAVVVMPYSPPHNATKQTSTEENIAKSMFSNEYLFHMRARSF